MPQLILTSPSSQLFRSHGGHAALFFPTTYYNPGLSGCLAISPSLRNGYGLPGCWYVSWLMLKFSVLRTV